MHEAALAKSCHLHNAAAPVDEQFVRFIGVDADGARSGWRWHPSKKDFPQYIKCTFANGKLSAVEIVEVAQ